MTIQEAVNQWYAENQKKRSPHTARLYEQGVRLTFLTFIDPSLPIEKLSPKDFIRYPKTLLNFEVKKRTVNSYIAGVKDFRDWLVAEGYLEFSFQDDARFKKAVKDVTAMRESQLPQVPKTGSAEVMIQAAETYEDSSPTKERNIAICLVLYHTAMRNQSLVDLRVKDIDLETRQITITKAKGRKTYKTMISETALEALQTYWEARGWAEPEDYAFARHDRKAIGKKLPLSTSAVREVFRNLRKITGLETMTPHKMRHAAATRALKVTKNIRLVQEMLGHSSINTSQGYAKVAIETLEEGYDQIF